MDTLQQTPLYHLHVSLGAKMTAFAGYRMPLQYGGGIIQEHLHCRQHVGFFDISHMGLCRIDGDEALETIEKLTPGGIVDLAVGAQKYTVLTNDNGGVIDDIIVTRTESGLSLVVNAACKDKDFAYLRRHLPGSCVFQVLTDCALLALQGPQAALVMAKFSADAGALAFMHTCTTQINGIACYVSRSGYTGEDGFEITVANADAERLAVLLLAEPDVQAIGLGARDTLRLEAGLCLYGHELSERITPVEAGLRWLFKKGHDHFPGAGKNLPQLRDGAARSRVGLLVDGRVPVRDGCDVYHRDLRVGYVTSGGYSPSLQKPLAMGLIDTAYSKPGTPLSAKVRDANITLTVTSLPFVAHRYLR
jgi:aminomethyltransferase